MGGVVICICMTSLFDILRLYVCIFPTIQVNSKVDGKAPIHWAIQENNIEALKCLLGHNADVDILVSGY